MSLLIDGYNLLNSVGIVGRGAGVSSLERSRRALLNFLAESLDAEEAARTTVVFDATDAPRGLPRVLEHRGLTVRFAAGYADADSLIEELIRTDTAPRRLTVVSSDHRLQRAARRRRATAVDSDAWFAEIARRRLHAGEPKEPAPVKPATRLCESEVAAWLDRFGGESALEELVESVEAEARLTEPPTDEPPPDDEATDKPTDEEAAQIGDPFPPGYAEDVVEDLSEDESLDFFPPGYGQETDER
jgi:hypothetical protein